MPNHVYGNYTTVMVANTTNWFIPINYAVVLQSPPAPPAPILHEIQLIDPTTFTPRHVGELMGRDIPEFTENTNIWLEQRGNTRVIGCAMGKVAYAYGARHGDDWATFRIRAGRVLDRAVIDIFYTISNFHSEKVLTIPEIAMALRDCANWDEVTPALRHYAEMKQAYLAKQAERNEQ